MAKVTFEIWVWAFQDDGSELHMLALAGPDGDAQRADCEPRARLLHVFEAGSRFEAMSYYYRYVGPLPYISSYVEDFAPYTEKQATRQKSGLSIGGGFGEGDIPSQ